MLAMKSGKNHWNLQLYVWEKCFAKIYTEETNETKSVVASFDC